jgi:hypothetical protein
VKDAATIDLFDWVPPPVKPHYNGPEYIPSRDHARLSDQTARVFDLMKDGRWRTLAQIAEATGDPEPSISAQLRHLRKERFGGHTVDRNHIGGGLYQYRLLVNE